MTTYADVQKEWLKRLDRLEQALDNPNEPRRGSEGLMKRWGALMVETSQRSFVDQKLGDEEWPPRYPGMESPFVNIAGALSDWNSGRANPKPNRFQDRPALVDEGMRGGLWGSISFRASKDEAEAGTNKAHARLHQEGGVTKIRLTEDAYKRGRNWLFSPKTGEPRKGREGYVKHLWPPLFRRFHRQNVIRRPFVGITEQLAGDLLRETEEYFNREQGLGGGRMVAAV